MPFLLFIFFILAASNFTPDDHNSDEFIPNWQARVDPCIGVVLRLRGKYKGGCAMTAAELE